MAESIDKYIGEVQEKVNELLVETGSPQQAFTKYVLEAMSEKGNLGEAEECYGIIRNDANGNVLGEINGYAISLSGETICLFYTIYEPPQGDGPYPVPADRYHNAINRLQGYYKGSRGWPLQ